LHNLQKQTRSLQASSSLRVYGQETTRRLKNPLSSHACPQEL